MAEVIFKRMSGSDIESEPIEDGALIFDTDLDSGKMYLDEGSERKPMGGGLTVLSTREEVQDNTEQGKVVDALVIKEIDYPMISTKEELEALTESGYVADALIVKDIDSNLANVDVYVGEDKKLHFVNASGVDTSLNFSSNNYQYIELYMTYTMPDAEVFIPTEFKPRCVLATRNGIGIIYTGGWLFDVNTDEEIVDVGSNIGRDFNIIRIVENGFYFVRPVNSAATGLTKFYII